MKTKSQTILAICLFIIGIILAILLALHNYNEAEVIEGTFFNVSDNIKGNLTGNTSFTSDLYQGGLYLSTMNRTLENATYIILSLETCKQISSNYGEVKYRCEGIWN